MGVRRYALVDKDGHVVNVVVVNPDDIGTRWQPEDGLTPVPSDVASPGDIYLDGKFYVVQEAMGPTDGGENSPEVYEVSDDGQGCRQARRIPMEDDRYEAVCEKFRRYRVR